METPAYSPRPLCNFHDPSETTNFNDSKTPQPSDAAEAEDYWSLVKQYLTEEEFSVICLAFRRQLTHRQIGKAIGKAKTNVTRLLGSAIEKLRGPKASASIANSVPFPSRFDAGHAACTPREVAFRHRQFRKTAVAA